MASTEELHRQCWSFPSFSKAGSGEPAPLLPQAAPLRLWLLDAQPLVLALAAIAQPSALSFEMEDLQLLGEKMGFLRKGGIKETPVTQTGLTDHFPGIALFCLQPRVCKPDRHSLIILWEVVLSCMVRIWGLIPNLIQSFSVMQESTVLA